MIKNEITNSIEEKFIQETKEDPKGNISQPTNSNNDGKQTTKPNNQNEDNNKKEENSSELMTESQETNRSNNDSTMTTANNLSINVETGSQQGTTMPYVFIPAYLPAHQPHYLNKSGMIELDPNTPVPQWSNEQIQAAYFTYPNMSYNYTNNYNMTPNGDFQNITWSASNTNNLQSPPNSANNTAYPYDNSSSATSPNVQANSPFVKPNFEDYYAKDKIRPAVNAGVRTSGSLPYGYLPADPLIYNQMTHGRQQFHFDQYNSNNYYQPQRPHRQNQNRQNDAKFKKYDYEKNSNNEKSEIQKTNDADNTKKYSEIVTGKNTNSNNLGIQNMPKTNETNQINNQEPSRILLNNKNHTELNKPPRNNYHNYNHYNQYQPFNYQLKHYRDLNSGSIYLPELTNLNLGSNIFEAQQNNNLNPGYRFDNRNKNKHRDFNCKYDPRDFQLPDEKENIKESKFFVIKSYSKDDVIHSIKYNIWCSTEEGNRRLDRAYMLTQNHKYASVYLLFSINGSGHFCGIAQMMSRVDYDGKSEIWSQDKWKGKFDVKWIFIKDVPNIKLRHIILKTNENKPVTNSRDTQEVPFDEAVQVFDVFRSHNKKTTILDESEAEILK